MTEYLWTLPEWKETRNRLIKDYCEQCNKRETTFVLLHLKPFPKALKISRDVRRKFLEDAIKSGKIKNYTLSEDEILKYTKVCCPECLSVTIAERKYKKPVFKCKNCKNEFNKPLSLIDNRDIELIQKRNEYNNEQLKKFQSEIDKEYQLKVNGLKEWYLSGDDTVTYCKSCAYQYRQGYILCQNCRKKYHMKGYELCFLCNSILCENCNKERIPKKFNSKICNKCQVEASTKLRKCEYCKEHKIRFDSSLKLCDDCVLEGHWID